MVIIAHLQFIVICTLTIISYIIIADFYYWNVWWKDLCNYHLYLTSLPFTVQILEKRKRNAETYSMTFLFKIKGARKRKKEEIWEWVRRVKRGAVGFWSWQQIPVKNSPLRGGRWSLLIKAEDKEPEDVVEVAWCWPFLSRMARVGGVSSMDGLWKCRERQVLFLRHFSRVGEATSPKQAVELTVVLKGFLGLFFFLVKQGAWPL